MAYVKTNWQNGVTPVNADNMNKIENELEALDQASGGGTQLYKHSIDISGGAWLNYAVLVFIDDVSTPYTSVNCPIKSASIASGSVGFDGEGTVTGYKITYYFGENDVSFIYTTARNLATFTMGAATASFVDNVTPL